MVTGIDAASSDYACIWCHCKKDEHGDIELQWSLSDTDKGARTIDENVELAKQPFPQDLRVKWTIISDHPPY